MRRRVNLATLLVMSLFLATTICGPVKGKIIYVDDDGPADFNNIQAAINYANHSDIIEVQPGTYTGYGNRDIDFLGKAITVRSTDSNDPNIIAATIIDCNGTETEPHRAFYFHNTEDVNSIVEGFTIINGYSSDYGGGIFCEGVFTGQETLKTQPTINHCVIRNCKAKEGGGISCYNSAYSTISNCIISDNLGGSGIYCDRRSGREINNCTITNNVGHGVGFWSCSTIISNCKITYNGDSGVFSGNSGLEIEGSIIANHKGSGIRLRESSATVKDCTISNNNNSAIRYTNTRLNLSDSILIGNYSPDYGGGINGFWDGGTIVENCVIIGNRAVHEGGGVLSIPSSDRVDIRYTNCTIVDNKCDNMGGGLSLGCYKKSFTNCIIWDNTAPNGSQIAVRCASSTTNVSYSNVEYGQSGVYFQYGGALYWGPGNIDNDPCFSLPRDYHILDSSPCIDAGTNSPTGGLPATDMYGRLRNLDGDNNGSVIVDMGAYEYEYNSTTPIIAISQKFFEFYNLNKWPNPDNQYFQMRNCAGGTLNWQITDDSIWLEAVPNRGTSSGEINEIALVVDTNALSYGQYSGEVVIHDANALNSPRKILVSLDIADDIRVPEDYPTIQEAIDAAGDGSTITVADGIYTGTGNRDINFKGKAIIVLSENGPDNCIIDCQNTGRGFFFDSYEENDSILRGFTITNGYYDEGGGIYCKNSGPTIISCNIINSLADKGGGVYAYNSNAQIVKCHVSCNYANDYGGGLYLTQGRTISIDSCIISNNSTGTLGKGCGIYMSGDAGGVFKNCMIVNNTGGIEGGAFYSYNGPIKMLNSTISGNSASSLGGLFYFMYARSVNIKNSILWGNIPNDIYDKYVGSTPITIEFSNFQNGRAGEGNIDADPCFVSSDSNDYHLRWDSPCIDSGDPTFVAEPNEKDIDGEPRIMGGRIDMGIDEVGEKQADLNRDGLISIEDVEKFTRAWLSNSGEDNWYILCDLYPDNTIDFQDWAELARDWLWQADWYKP